MKKVVLILIAEHNILLKNTLLLPYTVSQLLLKLEGYVHVYLLFHRLQLLNILFNKCKTQ